MSKDALDALDKINQSLHVSNWADDVEDEREAHPCHGFLACTVLSVLYHVALQALT